MRSLLPSRSRGRSRPRIRIAGAALLVLLALGRSSSTFLFAQEQPPKLLLDAAHCLATEKQDWLGLEHGKATTLSLGYLVDAKSYPGEKVLYLVDYTTPSRSEGLVFTIYLTGPESRRTFNIQNNARFRKSGKGIHGVDFVDDPLGGIWTQEHLVSAIKEIRRQPSFTVAVASLLKPSSSTQCESYADRGKDTVTVDPKTGNVHLQIPIPAPTKKQ